MRTILKLTPLLPTLAATSVFAHSGHGLGDGAHWHASDTWGWAAALVVGAAALWLGRRK